MLELLHKFLLVLFYLVLAISLMTTVVGFPGNWVLVGAALIVALVTGFAKMTWFYLLLCLGLALLGEAVESLLGAVLVVRKGGGKWGVVGSFLGGIGGVLVGGGVVPPFGVVLFGLLGAFLGAVAGELLTRRKPEDALRIGFSAFVGRIGAVAVKLGVGCAILWILVKTTWG